MAGVAYGPLHDNGIAVSQDIANDINGVSVTTTLLHESGESKTSSPCWLPVAKKDPQGYGSAITYARRYSLAAMLGISVDKDDDGNEASGAGRQEPPPPAGLAAIKSKLPTPPRPNGRPAAHDRNFTLNYGTSKGKPIGSLTDADLKWYRKTLTESVADPDKERYLVSNQRALDAVTAELVYRGA